MIERTLFSADHEAFRDSFKRFCEKEIAPHHDEWEEQGYVDRAVWNKAGENGFLCATMPEAYGGADADKLYSVVQVEELSRAYGERNTVPGELLVRVTPSSIHGETDIAGW